MANKCFLFIFCTVAIAASEIKSEPEICQQNYKAKLLYGAFLQDNEQNVTGKNISNVYKTYYKLILHY